MPFDVSHLTSLVDTAGFGVNGGPVVVFTNAVTVIVRASVNVSVLELEIALG